VTPDLLADAFEKLSSNSVVLGPATDGGYYLIGLARYIPELFLGVTWGTDRVLSESLKILGGLNLTPALLPPLDDIDRPEDLPVWERIARAEDGDLQRVSVIIPTLDESGGILPTLESVVRGSPLEMLVVDGGSSDGTPELAQKTGATVLRSKPSRARQMNAGAAMANGNVLLFLHADTILPQGWTSVVSRVMQNTQVAAGAFGFLVAEDFPGRRMLERAVNWRSRRFQMPYGDQALFLRRSLFEEIGGFANLPIMEDYELVRRLHRHGRIIMSSLPAITSGRRWRRYGLIRVTLKNQLMIAGFRLGLQPQTLARFYRGKH
jgi:rSAM/selenodomain-associated transferase 2